MKTKHYATLVNDYYNVCTKGYREVWGSDHFHQYFWDNNETREEGLARTHATILKHMNLSPDSHVADLGCGIGTFSIEILAPHFKHITAVNINAKHLKAAKQKAKEQQISTIDFVEGDIMKLEYDNKFDGIFLYDVEPHLPDRKKALKNIYDALKPGGKVMITAWLKPEETNFVAEEFLIKPFCQAFAYPFLETNTNLERYAQEIGFKTIVNEDWTTPTARSVNAGYLHALKFAAKATKTDMIRILELDNLVYLPRAKELATQMANTVLYWKALLDAELFIYRFYVLEKPQEKSNSTLPDLN